MYIHVCVYACVCVRVCVCVYWYIQTTYMYICAYMICAEREHSTRARKGQRHARVPAGRRRQDARHHGREQERALASLCRERSRGRCDRGAAGWRQYGPPRSGARACVRDFRRVFREGVTRTHTHTHTHT